MSTIHLRWLLSIQSCSSINASDKFQLRFVKKLKIISSSVCNLITQYRKFVSCLMYATLVNSQIHGWNKLAQCIDIEFVGRWYCATAAEHHMHLEWASTFYLCHSMPLMILRCTSQLKMHKPARSLSDRIRHPLLIQRTPLLVSYRIASYRIIYISSTVISNVWCSTRHEITFHRGKILKTLHKL